VADAPDFSRAVVDRSKIVDDLLGDASIASRAKAKFFGVLGFSQDRWEVFADALRAQAGAAEISATVSPWGTKYVAAEPTDAPNGRR
jgi:xanthine/CO dehydrogenase XdhC/CoxF family maturation factor